MRRLLVPLVLLAAMLLAGAEPALAQGADDRPRAPTADERGRGNDNRPRDEAPPTPTPPPAGSGAPDDPQGRGRGRSDEAPGRAEERRAPPAEVGSFEVVPVEKRAAGEYVAFSYNDTGVQGFSAGGVKLFDLQVDGPGRRLGHVGSTVTTHGAQLRLKTANFSFQAHDAPTAATKLDTDGSVRIAFAPGTRFERLDGDRVQFTVGNVTGTLKGDNIALDNETDILLRDGLLVVLDKPRGKFDQHRGEIVKAVTKGDVGAEATFNLQPDGGVQEDVVSYANVTITTRKAERGNLTVDIEGHGTEGRVIVLNVDRRVLGAQETGSLNVTIDGLLISHASDLADILDPDNDGFLPEYYIVHDPLGEEDAFQLIVTLPHYSVHTLSITTAFVLPPPSVVLGIVAGIAVLAPAAFVLFRRK